MRRTLKYKEDTVGSILYGITESSVIFSVYVITDYLLFPSFRVSSCKRASNLEFRRQSTRQQFGPSYDSEDARNAGAHGVRNGSEEAITYARNLQLGESQPGKDLVALETNDKDTRNSFMRSPRGFDFIDTAKNRLSTGSGQLFLDYFPPSLSNLADMIDSYFALDVVDGGENSTGVYQNIRKNINYTVENEHTFVSETKYGSKNPSWQLLPDSISPDKVLFENGKYSLTLWGRRSADSAEYPSAAEREFQVLSEWVLDFSALEFMGKDLADHEKVFPPNTLLLEFPDGFFKMSKAPPLLNTIRSKDHTSLNASHGFDKPVAKLMFYSIVAAQKELLSIQSSINTLQKNSEALTSRKVKLTATERKAEVLGRIAFVEKEMMARTQNIQSSRMKLKEQKDILAIRNRQLRESGPDRESTRHALDLKQAELGRTKLGCAKACAHISFRQRRLIFDMRSVYPIELVSAGNVMSIRGIKLPNSEFSEVPLRYPINPMSSRSMILDRVSRQFPGSREFPLFLKGVDKMRFEYGVFLLNKDIEQLMNHVGINLTNLRNTLPNLKALIEAVGEDSESQSEDDLSVGGVSLSTLSISRQEDYADAKSPSAVPGKAQYSILSSHGPDSNSAFTSETSLKLLKPYRSDTQIDEDDELDYPTGGGGHLDEFVKRSEQNNSHGSVVTPLFSKRSITAEPPRPLLFPVAVSSASSLTPGDFWPEAAP
ncbi:hypothetical protein HDU67_000989 [Dinochytrium kinnereticum]|nr:hypothetical protein HDU67_000989 [Dinochytrium kinnereticum]